MIALKENGARLVDFVVDLRARGAVTNDVVMNLLSIQDNGNFVPNDCGFDGLPLSGGLGSKLSGSSMIVNRTIADLGGLSAFIVTQNLNLVTSAQIEAAVGTVRDHVVVADREVPEFFVRDEIGAVLAPIDGILEHTIFDGPAIVPVRSPQMLRGIF